ncbi:MAG: transposase [Aphanizomenon flos-aquae KM1D3_PB]|uniref:RNA-guided endonuclease InsQ/TnpB family protein n=1 Tax=Aphanizomenon flos-aquae TaxID=1176 RepID=UPI0005432318|nr:RNA-guided endonuclease TnpB family protein [Aphanizomenon flos-aquae]KHG41528.1 transposase [Aphanizomenon flos-aquae 2012/KM1/D3]QSV70292.1 MAG: transposase [Aphanizomenon flos-aquae KM1D3_PB]
MIVLEYKVKGKQQQYNAIDDAIRTTQFVRNKAIRFWMDAPRELKLDKFALNKYSTELRIKFPFTAELNSMAVQSAAERAWFAISRFYDNCKSSKSGKKGFPRFQKDCRSVEYKTSGWKLHKTKRRITFTDKKGIGELKLLGKWDIQSSNLKDIKRVRLIRRADGYYAQFCVGIDVVDIQPKTGVDIGLDVGIESFYTDSNGHHEPNPKFLRKAEKSIKHSQRRIYKKRKGSSGRKKARKLYAKKHLKVSRQRNEHAKRMARNVCKFNDLVAYEDLRVSNLVKNHCLAKSISDASWYLFRQWIEYFAVKFDKVAIAVAPHYTSQKCSSCGVIVKKSLSTRTHNCSCGCELHRDTNAAINILNLAKNRGGHPQINATGVEATTLLGANLEKPSFDDECRIPSALARGVSMNSQFYS